MYSTHTNHKAYINELVPKTTQSLFATFSVTYDFIQLNKLNYHLN